MQQEPWLQTMSDHLRREAGAACASTSSAGNVLNSGWWCRRPDRPGVDALIRREPVRGWNRVDICHANRSRRRDGEALRHAQGEIGATLLAIRHHRIAGWAAIHRLHHAGHVNRHPSPCRRRQGRNNQRDDRKDRQQSRKEQSADHDSESHVSVVLPSGCVFTLA